MSANQPLPNSIVIHETLAYGNTSGKWTIAFCLEKLRTKYESTHESYIFDGYIATRAGTDPSWINRIEQHDAEMTWLMNSHLTDEEINALMWRADRIADDLREVPNDLDLAGNVSEEVYRSIASALASFIRPYVRLPKAIKVLFMKRPRLIPMIDSYVLSAIFDEEKERNTTTGILAIWQFRELMRYGRNLETLVVLVTEMNQLLAGGSDEHPPVLTPVRILDHLL
jgi:hypothetical protein